MVDDSEKKVSELISELLANKDIPDDTKAVLASKISLIGTPLDTDPWVYRIVVIFLGLTVLGTVVGGFSLSFKSGISIPEGLIALGSAAVGALAGLLAPSPGKR